MLIITFMLYIYIQKEEMYLYHGYKLGYNPNIVHQSGLGKYENKNISNSIIGTEYRLLSLRCSLHLHSRIYMCISCCNNTSATKQSIHKNSSRTKANFTNRSFLLSSFKRVNMGLTCSQKLMFNEAL